jgi:hypothetical protein
MGNNTYVYVGIEETAPFQGTADNQPPGGQPSQVKGIGRIAVAVVASVDGTRPYLNSPGPLNASSVIAVGRLRDFDDLHIAAATMLTNGEMANRPPASTTGFIDLSTAVSTVSFTWPLNGIPEYTFTKVIEIDPQGIARIQQGGTFDPTIPSYIEIPLLPTHGSTLLANNPNQAAIQLDGMTGTVNTYRP